MVNGSRKIEMDGIDYMSICMTVALVLLFHFPLSISLLAGLHLPLFPLLFVAIFAFFRGSSLLVPVVLAFSALAMVSLVVALSDLSVVGWLPRLASGGQLVYNVFLCSIVAFCKPVDSTGRELVSKIFLFFGVVVFVLAILEVFTPFKSVSDYARGVIYSSNLYGSDERDLDLAGHIRPKVFTSEPSHAAWSMGMMFVCAVAFERGKRFHFVALFVLCCSMWLFASPTLLVPMGIVLLSLFVKNFEFSAKGVLFLGGIVAVGIVVLSLVVGLVLYKRYGSISVSKVDQSTYLRVVQPFELAKYSLEENVFIGVGFKGLDKIWNKISYLEGGARRANVDINVNCGMSLMTIPVFSGLIGVAWFASVLVCVFLRWRTKDAFMIGFVLLACLLQVTNYAVSMAWIVASVWCWRANSFGKDE